MVTMKRTLAILALGSLGVLFVPTPAAADGTFFFGLSPKPASRPLKGFAVGINMIVVGFEFEYANTEELATRDAPGLKTFMMNGLIMTPTSGAQLYLTAGGGFYRENLLDNSETSFGTNVGGGIKMRLAGPLRLRLDYRVFALRGSAVSKTPQRFYVGANVAF